MGFLDGKTEPATQKRREDARRKGQVVKSREVVSVAVLLAGYVVLRAVGPTVWERFSTTLAWFLGESLRLGEQEKLAQGLTRLFTGTALLLLPLMLAVLVAAVVANVGQTGPMLIGEGLKVDLTKLNPATGLKRLFSANALAELAKAAAKVALVGWVVYVWLRRQYPSILELCWMDLGAALSASGRLIGQLVGRTLGVLTLIAALDWAWQRFQHERSLMMTKEEIKDELKQQEGSPEVRGAIRRRQRELARRSMMQSVRTADVVVTNPTHYAVALKYDPLVADAPQVVAKGQRLNALRIREIAEEAQVPIVENPPLARALFAACDLGDLVPPELYAAVAEVLAFVFRLRGRAIPTG